MCPAKTEAKAKVILPKIYAGALYGVEAAGASLTKVASLTAAVIDVFKSRNNDHNANQSFSTMTGSKSDLDPVTQILPRRVLQIRRTACKQRKAGPKFKSILKTYVTKHKRNGKWPRWYRDEEQEEGEHAETYPDEQPHPSTNEHVENWDDGICSVGPIGLLIESVLWNGMQIDAELRIWQRNEQPISILEVPYQNLKTLVLKASGRARNRAEWHRGVSSKRGRAPLEIDNDISRIAPTLHEEGKASSEWRKWEVRKRLIKLPTTTRMLDELAPVAMKQYPRVTT